MCKFFSAILTKQGKLLYNLSVDSHEDLIKLFELRDDEQSYIRQPWVRLEFVPDLTKDVSKKENWKLRLDETNTPDWWDADKASQKCWDVIKKIIITDHRKLLVDGVWILAGDGKVDKLSGRAYVKYMHGSSQVEKMWDSSRVGIMCDTSQVGTMRDTSRVGTMWDSSRVGIMCDTSQVGTMRDSSRVGTMWGSSRVEKMLDDAKIIEDNR